MNENTLSRLPYWDKLTAEEREQVRAGAFTRRFGKGELIHGGCDSCLGQIFVLAGEVRAYLLSEEGREVTLFMLREGDPCVLSASCVINQITFETHMIAKQDTELLVVSLPVFSRLAEQNIYVRCFVYEMATQRFSSVMWSMQQILFLGFDRRLAAFLVGEYDRTGERELRMTHEQIAEHVNSAREVVARMLKRFATDGLVEVKRGVISLTDIDALRDIV